MWDEITYLFLKLQRLHRWSLGMCISPHTLLGTWLHIHAWIEVKPSQIVIVSGMANPDNICYRCVLQAISCYIASWYIGSRPCHLFVSTLGKLPFVLRYCYLLRFVIKLWLYIYELNNWIDQESTERRNIHDIIFVRGIDWQMLLTGKVVSKRRNLIWFGKEYHWSKRNSIRNPPGKYWSITGIEVRAQ